MNNNQKNTKFNKLDNGIDAYVYTNSNDKEAPNYLHFKDGEGKDIVQGTIEEDEIDMRVDYRNEYSLIETGGGDFVHINSLKVVKMQLAKTQLKPDNLVKDDIKISNCGDYTCVNVAYTAREAPMARIDGKSVDELREDYNNFKSGKDSDYFKR